MQMPAFFAVVYSVLCDLSPRRNLNYKKITEMFWGFLCQIANKVNGLRNMLSLMQQYLSVCSHQSVVSVLPTMVSDWLQAMTKSLSARNNLILQTNS